MPAENDSFAKVNNIRDKDFRSIYSNNAAFQVGIFDYSIFFGEVVAVDQSGESMTVEQRVKVTMAPLHAKIFVYSAVQQLRAYEKQFGEIKVPEGLIVGPPLTSNAPEAEKKEQS